MVLSTRRHVLFESPSALEPPSPFRPSSPRGHHPPWAFILRLMPSRPRASLSILTSILIFDLDLGHPHAAVLIVIVITIVILILPDA